MASSTLAFPPSSPPTVDVLIEKECFWVHNALTIEDQIKVFQDLLERSKHVDNTQKRPCMNPTPRTLIFDDGLAPTLRFGKKRDGEGENAATSPSLSSVYDKLILRRSIFLASHHIGENRMSTATSGWGYDRYSVGVIRYTAPNGRFPEHVDHCNDQNGWVFLLSLGCKAEFSVQKRLSRNGTSNTLNTEKQKEKLQVELNSGDVLIFDPSSEAAISHGVVSIVPSTCPPELIQTFGGELMANHRYGVQLRTSLGD